MTDLQLDDLILFQEYVERTSNGETLYEDEQYTFQELQEQIEDVYGWDSDTAIEMISKIITK